MAEGRFREDLLARVNLWSFTLPGLADWREDIAPNLDYELDRHDAREGVGVTFNKEARARYLNFAVAPDAPWLGNFRDLAASITRMATLAPSGRIDSATVEDEIKRLRRMWTRVSWTSTGGLDGLVDTGEIDPFDRVQLVEVVRVCRASRSLSEAGRTLFRASSL